MSSPSTGLSASGAAGSGLRDDAFVMGLVGLAHGTSHFAQLLLPPLFPWLRTDLQASYAELGLLMAIYFTVSCAVQAMAGFVADRVGPRPVMLGGMALVGVAVVGFALATSYWAMAGLIVLAGIGNGVFHPVDFSILNVKVSAKRLGHAYSTHGITGSMGWALAPALVVPVALASSWRVALGVAALLIFAVLLTLWLHREKLAVKPVSTPLPKAGAGAGAGGLDFLRIPVIWMCLTYFFFSAIGLSTVQIFAPEAARHLHGMQISMVAVCLTVFMICNGAGMVFGGFLASSPERCERVIGGAFGFAALLSLTLAFADLSPLVVPVIFGAMGIASGMAGPSRDMLVKTVTPAGSTGRVYGVVYSGLDVGQALAPLIFGVLMDQGNFRGVLVGLALSQAMLIFSAFNVRKVRRVPLERPGVALR
ncbi:MAG: MFS transporter [Burkholderiaceae bacterium]|nr:MFS transporter [Burkholderiaceae bacterium]